MAPSVCQIGSLTLSVPIIGTKSRVGRVLNELKYQVKGRVVHKQALLLKI